MTTVDESAPLDDQLGSLQPLHHPVRRSLYRYVAGQPGEVSRDQAASAVGVQRSLAAFHLDNLVEGGLLEASYRRLNGRTGPGAGRPAKLYRRSERQYQVSLPPRQYELAAVLLAEALEAEGSAAADAVVAVARRRSGTANAGRGPRGPAGSRAGRRATRPRRASSCPPGGRTRFYH